MPQSLSLAIVHVIFGTKDRHPFITSDVRDGLHAYLATAARSLECECYRAGGIADHVHLAIRLSRKTTISDLILRLKTDSSKWMKSQPVGKWKFAWQRGYACFSIGPKDIKPLIDYIDKQEEHHRTQTFQEEFRMFLDSYGVDYDETYVWD